MPPANAGTQLSYTSKYDFVQGDKIIAYEDFEATNLGDFPVRWNTNASAEVVAIAGMDGKWLKIGEKGVFHPEFINNLPENFTFEFDLAVNNANYFSPFCLNIASLKKPEDFADYAYLVSIRPEHAVHLEFSAANSSTDGISKLITGKAGVATISNAVNYKDVERYHLYKRQPALMDRIFEILKRLGAEDDYLKVVRAMEKPTPKFLENVDGKIAALEGSCEELNSIILLTTGKISYEGLFQKLDAWTLEWDKKHAQADK